MIPEELLGERPDIPKEPRAIAKEFHERFTEWEREQGETYSAWEKQGAMTWWLTEQTEEGLLSEYQAHNALRYYTDEYTGFS